MPFHRAGLLAEVPSNGGSLLVVDLAMDDGSGWLDRSPAAEHPHDPLEWFVRLFAGCWLFA